MNRLEEEAAALRVRRGTGDRGAARQQGFERNRIMTHRTTGLVLAIDLLDAPE